MKIFPGVLKISLLVTIKVHEFTFYDFIQNSILWKYFLSFHYWFAFKTIYITLDQILYAMMIWNINEKHVVYCKMISVNRLEPLIETLCLFFFRLRIVYKMDYQQGRILKMKTLILLTKNNSALD